MKKLWIESLLVMGIIFTLGSISKSAWAQSVTNISPITKSPTITIGDEPVIILERPRLPNTTKPQFLTATLLPGNGMNLLQIKAYLPGKGEIDLLASPSLSEAKQLLDNDNDVFRNKAFTIGSAILLPFANRIRGTLSADGKFINTMLADQKVLLPANWQGKNPGAEKHAIHGLMLSSQFAQLQYQNKLDASSVSGTLHAGNFNGHWPSQTDVYVKVTLQNDTLNIVVTAKNVGQEPLPMGIGAHPYFVFPSGDRKQVKLHLPSATHALANNYDDVFPTGELVTVKGTPFDFTAINGAPLGTLYMDDSFTNLQRNTDGSAVVTVVDPETNYGLRITAISPEIKAIQVYAPPDKNFIAIEPQFNLVDPYAKIWGKTDTGMVLLQPGQSVSWHVRLELFTPKNL